MSAPAPGVRVLVNPQALEKIPEVFRGTVYETATYMVDHCYNATSRDLREIEMRSPEHVMESSLGMTLTVSLSYHRFFLFFFSKALALLSFYLAGGFGSPPEHISVHGQDRRD